MTMLAHVTTAALMTVLVSDAATAQRSDTTVIRVGAPLHPGVATLVEEVTLGEGSDAEEYTFSSVRLSSGRDGSVYVIDSHESRASAVRQYDRTGKFVRAFGRNGQGPGEYVEVVGDVAELPDSRVLLSDSRGILVYSKTGEPLARWIGRARAVNVGSQIMVDPSGFVLTNGVKPREGDPPTMLGSTAVPIMYRFRFDGSVVDTIVPPQTTFPPPIRIGRTSLPFSPTYVTAWSPLGYFVTAHTASYAIDLRVPVAGSSRAWRPGDPVRSIRRAVPAVRVGDDERADWRQSMTMFNRSGSARNATWQWSGPDIPRVKPPVNGVYVANDGRIWVRLSQPGKLNPSVSIPSRPASPAESYGLDARQRWTEPYLFDVYEPSGRFVGQVRFPDGTVSYTIDGDIIWASTKDADDVPIVKRYRISWGR